MNKFKPQPQLDALQLLEQERQTLKKALKKSQQRMKDDYHNLISPTPAPTNTFGRLLHYMESGMNIYRGVKMGYRIGDALSMVLGVTKLLRRWR